MVQVSCSFLNFWRFFVELNQAAKLEKFANIKKRINPKININSLQVDINLLRYFNGNVT